MTLNIEITRELLYISLLSLDHSLCYYRAEELEVALGEMVKQDNRRQLKAKVFPFVI